MNRKLSICAPEFGLKEHELPTCLYNRPFTSTFTKLHWRNKAALDLDRGQPSLRLRVGGDGDEHVNHRDRKPTLNIAEVIPERWLRCKDQDHATSVEVCVLDNARRQGRAVWFWLSIEHAL